MIRQFACLRNLRLFILVLVHLLALLCGAIAPPPALLTRVALAQAQAAVGAEEVIVNEIFYDPISKTELIEFIELYNRGPQRVDLVNWTLVGAVDYTFPPGSVLEPGAFVLVAQQPAALQSRYGVDALGPFSGALNNSGETITLRNAVAGVVDEVTYALGFPWPVTGDEPERSIQLINPAFDNQQPSNWRSALPTPGAANAGLTDNPPPAISSVTHTPQTPTASTAITVTAIVSDADGVLDVQLFYQLVAPGNYIRLSDPAYSTDWTPMAMAERGDNVYTVTMPPEASRHRYLVRYRIYAADKAGNSITAPYADDPQPNFAFFVYDGPPVFYAAIQPGAQGERGQVQAYDFAAMRPAPIYQLLANHSDVENAQFIPNSNFAIGYMGNDYPWSGTLIYNGQVYDHIGFRARGGIHRYSVGKNGWKFNFRRGHRFQGYDDYGRPFPVLRDKLNLSPVIKSANRGYRGEQGMFESLSMRLFNLFGVPASESNFVHFRVVAGPDEGGDQYGGDFWGLYLAYEELDGNFLQAHGLPDGNLYKMEFGTGELNNQGLNAPGDKSDLNAFLGGYEQGQPDLNWWRQNFDLASYYSYRAVLEVIHHYDVNEGKNYLYFRDPNTLLWRVLPWDLDLTWTETMTGDGNEPFRDRVLAIPEFQLEFQNRLRELRDLLFNPDQIFPMIDEYAVFINTPAAGLALVDADRAKWDFNPILGENRYVEQDRAGQGRYYDNSPSQDFAGMTLLMKEYVARRGQWLDETLLNDTLIPATPTLSYSGPAGMPADQLAFTASPFLDSSAAFAAQQWRIAEIMHPGLPGYVPDIPNRYEIDATWQSPELTTYTPTWTPPPGACPVGHICRVRVRMKNALGRWSHWSAPLEFVAGAPALPPVSTLKITEIMYHPSGATLAQVDELEFVELKNVSADPLDLGRLKFSGGIDYQFPPYVTLPAGELLILAKNAAHFAQSYGFQPFAEYGKKLSNSTETLVIEDAFGRTVLRITYADSPPWPDLADGLGYSLVLNTPEQNLDPNWGGNWRASYRAGGSPGVDDPLPLLINEVLAQPAPNQAAAVEIYNPTTYALALQGWTLADSSNTPHPLPNSTIAPGQYLVFKIGQLAQGAGPFVLNRQGGTVRLAAPSLTADRGYEHRFDYRLAPAGVSTGRYENGVGQERFPLQQTPSLGAANGPPAVGPLVFSEVMYNADAADADSTAGGFDFIEIANISDQVVALYDTKHSANTWRLNGVHFQFPSGVSIPALGKLVVTSADPTAICTNYTVTADVRVLGPIPLPLADNGQYLALERPLAPNDEGVIPYVVVDELSYTNRAPWPRALAPGVAMERLDLNGYGDDPLNWRRGVRENDAIRAAELGPAVDLCSFDAYRDEAGQMKVQWVSRWEEHLLAFEVWRSTDNQRGHAVAATEQVIAAQGNDTSGFTYTWVDATADPTEAYTYWLVAVGVNDEAADVGQTSVRSLPYQVRLPFVFR